MKGEIRRDINISGAPLEVLDLPAPDDAPADAILLLHEGLGCVELWRDLPHEVHAATGRRTVAFSRHGYGRSRVRERVRTADYLHREAVEVLPQVVRELQLGRTVLVGHSDGASIALIAVGTGAVDATAVVAIAPHVVVEDTSVRAITAARAAYVEGDLRRRLARYHDDVDAAFWGWNDVWLSDDFRSWDITDIVGRVRVPLLVIQGDRDPYGTWSQVELVKEAAAGRVDTIRVVGTGHAPHLEHPEPVRAAIIDFVLTLNHAGVTVVHADRRSPSAQSVALIIEVKAPARDGENPLD